MSEFAYTIGGCFMVNHEPPAFAPPERVERVMEEMAAEGMWADGKSMRERFLAKCGDLPDSRVDRRRTPEEIAEFERHIEAMERRVRSFPLSLDSAR